MAVNVLIVDDSSVMRSVIEKSLRMCGLVIGELHKACNGQEALDLLAAHWVDLILLDLNMPVMDGATMMQRLREKTETRDTPVIVVSTEGSVKTIGRLKDMGASFIHKPFSPEQIRDVIKQVMGEGGFLG